MCASRWLLTMMVCAVTVSALGVVSVGAADRDDVNRFYRQIVDLLKSSPKASPKSLAEIVQKNPAAGKECLKQALAKRNQAGPRGEAIREFADRLEETLYLISGTDGCNEAVAQRLLNRVGPHWTREENYFVLEKLATSCPNLARVYHLLGDQYVEEKRMGMAVDAYRKGLALKDDPDSRKLLASAEKSMKHYQEGNPIIPDEIHEMVRNRTVMGASGITRKVDMEVRIQRRILFDEWSHSIKDQFAPELKMVGDTLKQDFSGNPGSAVLIEGHTDRRGPLQRNMLVSRERAESVKRFLVEHVSVDPSRIKTEGLGPTKPYDPRENDAGWTLNRRVEFKVINLSGQQ